MRIAIFLVIAIFSFAVAKECAVFRNAPVPFPTPLNIGYEMYGINSCGKYKILDESSRFTTIDIVLDSSDTNSTYMTCDGFAHPFKINMFKSNDDGKRLKLVYTVTNIFLIPWKAEADASTAHFICLETL